MWLQNRKFFELTKITALFEKENKSVAVKNLKDIVFLTIVLLDLKNDFKKKIIKWIQGLIEWLKMDNYCLRLS